MAMIAINLSGASSAHDVVRNPVLQSPSIGRIKDRGAGMSAEETIAYAASVSTVKMETQARQGLVSHPNRSHLAKAPVRTTEKIYAFSRPNGRDLRHSLFGV